MATAVETIERDGRQIIVYDNGLERDARTGRIVAPSPSTLNYPGNPSNPHQIRRQKTEAAIEAAASALAQREADSSGNAELRAAVGNDADAWVRAVAMGRTRAAMDSDNPYGNGAAEWLMRETGRGIRVQPDDQQQRNSSVLEQLGAEIVGAFLSARRQRRQDDEDVIDAE